MPGTVSCSSPLFSPPPRRPTRWLPQPLARWSFLLAPHGRRQDRPGDRDRRALDLAVLSVDSRPALCRMDIGTRQATAPAAGPALRHELLELRSPGSADQPHDFRQGRNASSIAARGRRRGMAFPGGERPLPFQALNPGTRAPGRATPAGPALTSWGRPWVRPAATKLLAQSRPDRRRPDCRCHSVRNRARPGGALLPRPAPPRPAQTQFRLPGAFRARQPPRST